MLMTNVAIQLYTVRNMSAPLPELIARAGAEGFQGVEFATRLADANPGDVRRSLETADLTPVAAHVDLSTLQTNRADILATAEQVGHRRLVIPHLSMDRFRTRDRLDDLCRELIDLASHLDERGCTLVIHTTREELLPYFGRPGIETLLARDALPTGGYTHLSWLVSRGVRRDQDTFWEATPLGRIARRTAGTGIEFEIDAKSIQTSGFDLGTVLDALGDRTQLVHLSDVVRTRRLLPAYAPVEPGDGLVNPGEITRAVLDRELEWLIVEHDDPVDPAATLRSVAALTLSHISA